ncbi:MAG: tetratricopeptide repeat protein [Chitinophagaceae bacterium]|nr:tetratricopeptide repeat protein [Chitinophagaceae bacterium]
MSMRAFLLIFSIAGCLHLPISGMAGIEKDDLRKLKASLAKAKGAVKVDLLNMIAIRYISADLVSSDSGIIYVDRAFVLAESLGYSKGACIAAGLYGKALLQKGLPDDALKYYHINHGHAKQLKDNRMMASAIRGIGQSLWFQGNYQLAIDTIMYAVEKFRKLRNYTEISDATLTISTIYGDQGYYEKAFEAAQQALELSEKYDDTPNVILSLLQLGKLYRSIGDFETALFYYNKAAENSPPSGHWTYRHLFHNLGDLSLDKHRYDSALYYYRQSFAGNPKSRMSQLRIGQYYLELQQYDSAYFYLDMLYTLGDKSGEGNIRYSAMIGLAKIYLHRKSYQHAMVLGAEVFEKAEKKNAWLTLRDACEILSDIYDSLGQHDQALAFYRRHVRLKNGIISEQFKGKLYEFKRIAEDEKKFSQIELLKKESQLKEQSLIRNQFLRNILIGAIIFLSLLGVFVFWNFNLKRKNENLRNERSRMEWQRAAADLEMQALRAQMNPHFIFNCLSSINRFILKNEPDQASDYLTRFSRLIRLVLINSQKSLILLEEEVEMLRLYIGMEQLRFKNQFEYTISYSGAIKPSNVMIPPLLLQPFCENAIWHGLMHKQSPGHLGIAFTMRDGVMECTITDDGIGREKASEIKKRSGDNRKSLGLKLTAERLALFNEDNLVQTSWRMEDLRDGAGNVKGTRVVLNIKYKEFIEEMAEMNS